MLTVLRQPVREIRRHNGQEIVGGSLRTEYELRYQLSTRSSIANVTPVSAAGLTRSINGWTTQSDDRY